MNYFHLLIDSLLYPKTIATYRRLSIGVIFKYIFGLLFLYTITVFPKTLQNVSSSLNEEAYRVQLEALGAVRYPIAFIGTYTLFIIYFFVLVTVLASIGMLYMKGTSRQFQFYQLFGTAALSLTWGVLCNIVTTYFTFPLHTAFTLLLPLYIYSRALHAYPKRTQPRSGSVAS